MICGVRVRARVRNVQLIDQERVHWTGLHRLLDSTTGMVSMTRSRLPGQQERGRKKHTHSKRSWASEEEGRRS